MADVIKKAIEKLRTLSTVNILSTKTSACDYDKNAIQDRIDIEFKIGRFTIPCQILLDNSSRYEFPADIIFQKELPQELKVKSEWLPSDWDIQREDCLYSWLKKLSENFSDHLVQSNIPRGVVRKTQEEEDDYQTTVITAKRRLIQRKENTKENRKKFMLAWLNKFSENIVNYDADDHYTFSLYLTFELDHDTWTNVQIKKNEALSKASFDVKIAKAKPTAPVIVHFRMGDAFPKNGLQLIFLSVTNTATPGSSIPETLKINCDVNQKTMDNPTIIMPLLAKKAIRFHLDDGAYF